MKCKQLDHSISQNLLFYSRLADINVCVFALYSSWAFFFNTSGTSCLYFQEDKILSCGWL